MAELGLFVILLDLILTPENFKKDLNSTTNELRESTAAYEELNKDYEAVLQSISGMEAAHQDFVEENQDALDQDIAAFEHEIRDLKKKLAGEFFLIFCLLLISRFGSDLPRSISSDSRSRRKES